MRGCTGTSGQGGFCLSAAVCRSSGMLYRGERFTFHVECILGGHGIMSAYAKAASALIVTAINGDPSREQPSWSSMATWTHETGRQPTRRIMLPVCTTP
jgi:hypothetical protein